MSHRTQVVLTDEQYALLRLRSTETGLPLGELVRRAVAATYGPSSSERLAGLDRSFSPA